MDGGNKGMSDQADSENKEKYRYVNYICITYILIKIYY